MSSQNRPATTRRYTEQQKEQAIRLVRLAREEGRGHGAVQRIAEQLDFGVESVRQWVKQADVDAGEKAGLSTVDRQRLKDLEAEVRELRRANEILQTAAHFFGAELDRRSKR